MIRYLRSIGSVLLVASIATGQLAPLMEDNTAIVNVPGRSDVGVGNWLDSYSVGNRCYCATNYDYGIGTISVPTPFGLMKVKDVCILLGPGPGSDGRPRYNDIQCGNGPANNNGGSERDCPGRIEYGSRGCKFVGPKWSFVGIQNPFQTVPVQVPTNISKNPTKAPVKAPFSVPVKVPSTNPIRRGPTSSSTKAPLKAPVKTAPKAPMKWAPIMAPTKAPPKAPTKATTKAPVKTAPRAPMKWAPIMAPHRAPTRASTKAPFKAPVKTAPKAPMKWAPIMAPTKAPPKAPTKAHSAPVSALTKAPMLKVPPIAWARAPVAPKAIAPVPVKTPSAATTGEIPNPEAAPKSKSPVEPKKTMPTLVPLRASKAPIAMTTKVPHASSNAPSTTIPSTNSPSMPPVTKAPVVVIDPILDPKPPTLAPMNLSRRDQRVARRCRRFPKVSKVLRICK